MEVNPHLQVPGTPEYLGTEPEQIACTLFAISLPVSFIGALQNFNTHLR